MYIDPYLCVLKNGTDFSGCTVACHDRLCAEAVQKKGSAWEEQRDLKKFTLKDGAGWCRFFFVETWE